MDYRVDHATGFRRVKACLTGRKAASGFPRAGANDPAARPPGGSFAGREAGPAMAQSSRSGRGAGVVRSFTIRPFFITKLTSRRASMSSSGFPGTATMSA